MPTNFERFPTIVSAGVAFFGLGVTITALTLIIAFYRQTSSAADLETLAANPTGTNFEALVETYKDQFTDYWPDGATPKTYAEVLDMGRDIYIAEGCWHCHTQQVRPVGNEDLRYGTASSMGESRNDLMNPQLFGTRRVGPDLSRIGGKYANAWHVAHFWNPRDVVPNSIMPRYKWFFDEKGLPNDKGFAIIAYMQWLGSYQPPVAAE